MHNYSPEFKFATSFRSSIFKLFRILIIRHLNKMEIPFSVINLVNYMNKIMIGPP